MSSQIKIGIVGCGNIVTAHLHAFRTLSEQVFENFRITALCDNRVELAEMYRHRGEGPDQAPPEWIPWNTDPIYVSDIHGDIIPDVFADWREMLRSARMDAVLIAAPIGLHHIIAMESFRAGKHVLCQKPLAVSVKAGRRMVEEAGERGLILGVGENLRYTAGTRTRKYLLDSGVVGDIEMMISAGAAGSLALGISPDAVFDGTPWRHQKLLAGGGYALDAGVHTFHGIRYLCGEIKRISAAAPRIVPNRTLRDSSGQVTVAVVSELEDTFFAHLEFESGAVGSIADSRAGHGEPSHMRAIYGTKGCLKGDEAILDGGRRISGKEFFDEKAPEELKEHWFPGGLSDAFALEQLDFLRSIESGEPMETDGEEGLRDLVCSFGVLESSAAERPVSLADILNGEVNAYQKEIDEHYGL